jgi:hypothetical protein
MHIFLLFLSQYPFVVLYGLQAVNYMAAAAFSRNEDHARLAHCYCYLASAFLCASLGVCHVLF